MTSAEYSPIEGIGDDDVRDLVDWYDAFGAYMKDVEGDPEELPPTPPDWYKLHLVYSYLRLQIPDREWKPWHLTEKQVHYYYRLWQAGAMSSRRGNKDETDERMGILNAFSHLGHDRE